VRIAKWWSVCLLLALPAAGSYAQDTSSWRRITALEDVSVVTCASEPRLSWIVRSREERRALFTPAFHKACPSGTLLQRIWPCCGKGRYQVIHSRAQLEEILATMAARPRVTLSAETREAYVNDVERLVPDFKKEALVFFAVPYGPTGNAKAFLDASVRGSVLVVKVRVEVPPPPLTPDTTTFYFALAVEKSTIRELELVTGLPAVSDLGIVSSTGAPQKISIGQ
jgi:hypothetical protein